MNSLSSGTAQSVTLKPRNQTLLDLGARGVKEIAEAMIPKLYMVNVYAAGVCCAASSRNRRSEAQKRGI